MKNEKWNAGERGPGYSERRVLQTLDSLARFSKRSEDPGPRLKLVPGVANAFRGAMRHSALSSSWCAPGSRPKHDVSLNSSAPPFFIYHFTFFIPPSRERLESKIRRCEAAIGQGRQDLISFIRRT